MRTELMRLSAVVTSAANPTSPLADTWVSVALSYQGLKALGVPQDSLDSFAGNSGRDGRARKSSRRHRREQPRKLGTAARDAGCPRCARRSGSQTPSGLAALDRPRKAYKELPGITAIGARTVTRCPPKRSPRIQGRHQPSGDRRERNSWDQSQGTTLKAGEFVLGYRDEMGGIQMTSPEILGRNGTYVVFRKLRQRVAEYLKANSTSPEEEELLAAKMMGRWRSGAPWRSARSTTIPNWAPTRRNNDFLYKEDDPAGFKTPAARTSGGQTRATRR